MSSRALHRFISLIVLLALVIHPLSTGVAVAAEPLRVATAPDGPQQPGYLFRVSVEFNGSRNLARLEQTGALVLRSFNDGDRQMALALVDAGQLADLARLGFRPQAADELRGLIRAQGKEKRWLADSLEPLLAQGDALAAQGGAAAAAGAAAAPDAMALAVLRAGVSALSVEQQAGTADSVSVDDDADGLTNTQEAWWCTDPQDPDTDHDGRSDGAEIQALRDWLGNMRESAPGETPWPNWPPQRTNCPDKDHDSIPNLAERWDLGLNMDLESSDRDKFDDGQELFGVTYCPGGDNNCGYGDLPRSSDAGYVGAQMPAWVKAPGKHPAVGAFPVPEVDILTSSIKVQAVTTVTTDYVISEGTEKSYGTTNTQGTGTSVADTTTWNSWQEVSVSKTTPTTMITALPTAGGAKSNLSLLKGEADFDATMQNSAAGAASVGLVSGSIAGTANINVGDIKPTLDTTLLNSKIDNFLSNLSFDSWFDDWFSNNNLDVNLCLMNCGDGNKIDSNRQTELTSIVSVETQDRPMSPERGGYSIRENYPSAGTHEITYQRIIPAAYPVQRPTVTEASTSGSSKGGAHTTTTNQYEEHAVTNTEAFSNEEAWGTATAVDSAHAADLWFTYKVRNNGTEYAREIGNLAFNIYIGDDPNPVYTYYVAPEIGGDGKLHNFVPGEEHTYTARHVPLTLDHMKAVDLGGPIRIVVEDFTYGVDELFYQDAANAGVMLAMEDGTADGDEAIDSYLVPTWGTETVLDVLGRTFPHATDADDNLTAIWTPEYRADTPAWCDAPNRTGNTLWCRHALSTADWWNVYTNGMGDGSEGFQDTPAAVGQTALFRFNSDSDLDGYSDRSEKKLGTDPNDPASFPRPELIAGLHSKRTGNNVVATLSLLNTGVYDAYGVEAVMIAPDDTTTITNNTVGGSGRVRAQRQIIVGSRITAQSPLPAAWLALGHAQPVVGGYYTGNADRTYTFTVAACGDSLGCAVNSAWTLNWSDDQGASGSLAFDSTYKSPNLRSVGAFGLQLGFLSGKVFIGDSFTVAATTPRDTFQYTIAAGHESDFTSPVVIVSYNDPQGNHRFVTPINLTSPTDDLIVHAGKMLHSGADVEIVTSETFDPDAPNTTNLVLQVPATRMVDAHAFLEFIDPDGNVVREEALTQTLETGPNIVPITWNPANFNPVYDPAKDYIVMAFFTDWQGNILGTAARPLSSFQADPTPAFAMDGAGATWNFGSVAQGTLLEHAFAFGNTGLRDLKAALVGTGARADQAIPGQPAWLDTGLDVTAGDAIGIRAGGTVCYGASSTICHGPDGSGSAASSAFTLPGISSYSLIGRIGTGAAFLVGNTYVSTAATAGRLYLGTNDETSQYSNNTGTYQAHIEIQGLPNSRGTEPNFSIGPADTGAVTVTLDTYYLPVGSFDRTLTLRSSDAGHSSQTLRVQGTVQPYVTPARAVAVSPYRPWDQRVIVAGDKNKRDLVAFNDLLLGNPASTQPLWAYDDARATRLGAGKLVARVTASGSGLPQILSGTKAAPMDDVTPEQASPAAISGLEDMFGDGRDGVMPSSGNLDNNNGGGIGIASGSAGTYSISVTDAYAGWRINIGDVVLVHQTQGSGAGCWELNKATSDYIGGTATVQLTKPLQCNYTSGGNSHAQIQRVPQYTDCVVSGTVTPLIAWNGSIGGIFAVMCNGTMSITGALNISGYGFTGGTHVDRPNRYGRQGESFSGLGSYTYLANEGGGGAGYGSTSANSRGGGGGGYGTAGQVGGGGDADDRYAGRGGNAYGDSGLTTTHLGSGGGAGGDLNSQATGGTGAGFSFISAREINVSGSITANGQIGVDGSPSSQSAGGGGGAGGAILLRANSIVVGTGRVIATGGVGGNGSIGVIGGAGGLGRIRIEYCNSISGTTNPPANQANIDCYSIIKGRVFGDTNGNGVQDSGESGLASVTVTVGSAGTVITNSAGDYTKTVSAPGNYTVTVAPPSGYHCITPCSVVASVNPDETKTVNFALQPRVSIAGKVFHDTNNNGSQGTGEAGVAGVTVTLNTGATRTTASDGSYTFADLMPGSYSVSVSVPDGYVNTTATTVPLTLTAGQAGAAHFGILMYTIEKVSSSDHANRFFLPESFRAGRRYWVQYGRSLTYASGGSLTAQVEAPQVHYGSAELDVFVTSPASSNIFLQVNLDVGCDSSQEWSVNGNYAVPATFAATGLAVGFNRYLATLPPDLDGSVVIPLCTSLNMAGQAYLTDLVLTPDGITDVSVAPSDIALNPTNPVEGDEVTVQAVIHNPTQFASDALIASFYATSADWGEWYVGSAFVPNVAAGGTAQAEILWNTLGFTGDVPVRVSVDPYNRIAETSEANNEATASLSIKTRPDLQVSEIALSDDEPLAGETVIVTLILRNAGQTAAGAAVLALYDDQPDDQRELICEDDSGTPAATTRTVICQWNPTAPGLHRLFARADRDQGIHESDEGNNDTWRDVHIGLASPLLLDSGGGAVYDPAYSTALGFGYLDADFVSACSGTVQGTQRTDPDGSVRYRFDHLLPGHFYHLDLTLYECDGLGRQEQVSIDDNLISGAIDLSDLAPHRLSFRLDPAFYADRSIVIAIDELLGNDAIVSEINLYDIDYRYADAGASTEQPYSVARSYGYLDGTAQSTWGSLPYRTRRIDLSDVDPTDDPDNELRYRFDRLDRSKRYQLHLSVYQGAGTATVQQSVAVDSVDTGVVLEVVGIAQDISLVDVPPGMYTDDATITVRITRLGGATAGAFISEIALEELTLLPEQESQVAQVVPLAVGEPNWISFNVKPPVRPAASCTGVTATTAFTTLNGDALLGADAVPVGSLVEAFTPGGVKTGCFKVAYDGKYGYMRVYGAEGATPGMQPGDPIILKINGIAADPTPYPVVWQDDKATREIDLSAPDVIPVETLLASISGKVIKLQCEDGTYLPPPADPRFNTCTTVEPGRSYMLWVNAATELTITGNRVPTDRSVQLHDGYNWLGYLPTCELTVATALQGLAGKYDILHNEHGTYKPPPANPIFNTFNTMAPGRGYMIHMTTAATLTYPAELCGGALKSEAATEPATGSCAAQPTSRFTHYYGQVDAPASSEVLAYSPSGEVVGCGWVDDGGLLPYLRVFGAEGETPGMQEGETVRFAVAGQPLEVQPSWRNDWGVHLLGLSENSSRTYLPLLLR